MCVAYIKRCLKIGEAILYTIPTVNALKGLSIWTLYSSGLKIQHWYVDE